MREKRSESKIPESLAEEGGGMTLEENRTDISRFTGYSGILLAVLLFGCFALAQTDRVLKEGDVAPDFSIATDDGKLQIVEKNLDECVLCRLCLDAVPGAVRVLKLYDGGAVLA